MKICQLNPLNTFMLLEGIYYTFQILFGINFRGFEFQASGNVCEIITYDVCQYCFLTYYLVVFCKHHIVCIQTFIRKKWFYGFPDFFVVKNTFDINITELFFFGLAEQFNIKVPLHLIIVPVFIRPLFVEIIFESGCKHYRFSQRFRDKGIAVKAQNFYFNWSDLVSDFQEHCLESRVI